MKRKLRRAVQSESVDEGGSSDYDCGEKYFSSGDYSESDCPVEDNECLV